MKGVFGCLSLCNNNNFMYSYNTYNDKFSRDKVDFENDRFTILIDGCVLNLNSLLNEYSAKSTSELIITLWVKYEEDIILQMKGSFVLIIYDKYNHSLFVSNDRLSKYPIYYYSSSENFVFSSRFDDVISYLKEKNNPVTLDKLGVAMMLDSGFIWEDRTYVSEIRCVCDYETLRIVNRELKHFFVKKPRFGQGADSEEVALEKFHALMSSAVELQFLKNKEYGYSQVATVSGGMDSRACLLLATSLGYRDITCITYAQSGSKDYEISRSLAEELNLDYFFHPLDSALFMLNPIDRIELNEGMQSYCGSTGSYRLHFSTDC